MSRMGNPMENIIIKSLMLTTFIIHVLCMFPFVNLYLELPRFTQHHHNTTPQPQEYATHSSLLTWFLCLLRKISWWLLWITVSIKFSFMCNYLIQFNSTSKVFRHFSIFNAEEAIDESFIVWLLMLKALHCVKLSFSSE